MPLVEAIRGHVFAAERIHADDTTVPVQAKGKTRTGRLWAYVRDDQPFGGPDPPAAAFFYSPDRGGEHPERHLASYVGLMQADAYAGFNRLYEATRKGGPISEAACWAHGRRKCQRAAESPQFWASKIPHFGELVISRWDDRSLRFLVGDHGAWVAARALRVGSRPLIECALGRDRRAGAGGSSSPRSG